MHSNSNSTYGGTGVSNTASKTGTAPIIAVQVILCKQSRQSSSLSPTVMIDREWLECLLTSYYLFCKNFRGEIEVRTLGVQSTYLFITLTKHTRISIGTFNY